MISKDLLLLSEQLNVFKVSHITISIFAKIVDPNFYDPEGAKQDG